MTQTKIGFTAFVSALGLAVTLVPMTAMAKQGERAELIFEELDADGDGQVTKAEIEAHRINRFTTADADGDGFLTRDEILQSQEVKERAEKRADRLIDRFDQNDDGKLSAEETTPPEDRLARRFERLDRDGNGSVSEEEFEAAANRFRKSRWHKRQHRRGDGN